MRVKSLSVSFGVMAGQLGFRFMWSLGLYGLLDLEGESNLNVCLSSQLNID